jgi:Sec-independent protein translocase protein TatA
MFDLSFGEIALAVVVAFVIFGPERFPVMLKEAITWIKKIKNMAFEAQRSLDHLGESIKEDLPSPDIWTPSSIISSGQNNSTTPSSALEPIEIDRNPEVYSKEGFHWRTTLQIDRDKNHYSSMALENIPVQEKPVNQNETID